VWMGADGCGWAQMGVIECREMWKGVDGCGRAQMGVDGCN
jgi:hypothetical protein